jgi:hypothetical protein
VLGTCSLGKARHHMNAWLGGISIRSYSYFFPETSRPIDVDFRCRKSALKIGWGVLFRFVIIYTLREAHTGSPDISINVYVEQRNHYLI